MRSRIFNLTSTSSFLWTSVLSSCRIKAEWCWGNLLSCLSQSLHHPTDINKTVLHRVRHCAVLLSVFAADICDINNLLEDPAPVCPTSDFTWARIVHLFLNTFARIRYSAVRWMIVCYSKYGPAENKSTDGLY